MKYSTPEAGAKIRVVNNTSICFHSLVTEKNLPSCYCGCRMFCDTSHSLKCSHSSRIQSTRHLMFVSDVTDSFEVLAELCDMLRKSWQGNVRAYQRSGFLAFLVVKQMKLVYL